LAFVIAVATVFAEPNARTAGKIYQKSFAHQKMSNANLRAANLRDTEMTMTDLRGADLRDADVTGSAMDRAELVDADLTGVVGLGAVDFGFGIDAQRASFRRADLRNARIPGRYFEGADFRNADLRGAFLAGRFHGARFDGAQVQDTVLLGALGIESLHPDLQSRGAIVNATDLVRSIQNGRDYSNCDLSGFHLGGVNLDSAPLLGANFHSAKLQRASLRRARCTDATFCWAKLGNSDLSQADLIGANFTGADLTSADLSNAKCSGARFGNARLRGARFAGTDLTGADFRGADLTGADLSGAVLAGVQWDAAIIADLEGVTPEEQAAIKSKAARWKYELSESWNQFVRQFSTPVWFAVWVAGVAVLFRARRRIPRHLSLRLMIGLHGAAAIPAFALLFLVVVGASPTAQLSGNLGGWSAWVQIWPLAWGFSLIALVGFVPIVTLAWIGRVRRPAPALGSHLAVATLLTGLSLAASTGTLLTLAPTA
jgi:uncharacterized protein YjbI with pentapeptide repeats